MSNFPISLRLVGDVHGKIKGLQKLQKLAWKEGCASTIQLGDLGCGFVDIPEFGPNNFFIRGNHDDPAVARKHPNYLGDYGVLNYNKTKVFFVGGAWSIDAQWRIEGKSWWRDEELSYQQLADAIDLYERTKPDVVLSHECPSVAMMRLLTGHIGAYHNAKAECRFSRTATALQRMFELHNPKYWIFGHHHLTENFQHKETFFQCLNELANGTLTMFADGTITFSKDKRGKSVVVPTEEETQKFSRIIQ